MTWKQVEYAVSCIYDMMNIHHGFKYHHIAVSARESMQLAVIDARRRT